MRTEREKEERGKLIFVLEGGRGSFEKFVFFYDMFSNLRAVFSNPNDLIRLLEALSENLVHSNQPEKK